MKENEADKVAEIGRELAEFSRRAFNRGLVAGTGGNMSARVPGTEKFSLHRPAFHWGMSNRVSISG